MTNPGFQQLEQMFLPNPGEVTGDHDIVIDPDEDTAFVRVTGEDGTESWVSIEEFVEERAEKEGLTVHYTEVLDVVGRMEDILRENEVYERVAD